MALPKQVQKDLSAVLGDVGLSLSESAVLLALLQSAKGVRATDLAKKTSLNRTTLYGVVGSLVEKGLVSSVEERGVLHYQSIQPDLLINHVERAKEKFALGAEKIKKAVSLIEAERVEGAGQYPSVKFFEGVEGIKQVYEDTIRNNKSKQMYGFMGTDALVRLMDSEWAAYYVGTRAKLGVHASTVAIDTPTSRRYKGLDAQQLRIIKLLPPGYEFEIEVVAYDNKVLITSFSREHPLSVLIEDEKIAHFMVSIFRYVNSTLKE